MDINGLIEEIFPELDLKEEIKKTPCCFCNEEIDTLFYFFCPSLYCNEIMCVKCMTVKARDTKFKVDEMNELCKCKRSLTKKWELNTLIKGKNKTISNGSIIIDTHILDMLRFWCEIFGNCIFEYLSHVTDRKARVYTNELCRIGITGFHFCLKSKSIEEAQIVQVYFDFFGDLRFFKEVVCTFPKFRDLYACQVGKLQNFKKKISDVRDFRYDCCKNMSRLFLFIDFNYNDKYDDFIEIVRTRMGKYLESRREAFKKEKSIDYMLSKDYSTGDLVNLYI